MKIKGCNRWIILIAILIITGCNNSETKPDDLSSDSVDTGTDTDSIIDTDSDSSNNISDTDSNNNISDSDELNTNFYIDSNNSNASDEGPGDILTPWKSMSPLNNHIFKPGSTIHFARGSKYSQGVTFSSSGTSDNPIILTDYGKGDPPHFSSESYNNLHGNVFNITGSYVTIDNLYFESTSNAPSNENDKDILQVGAIFVSSDTTHVNIKNCEFTDTPIGINFLGKYGLVSNNYIHDTTRFLSSPDWGPLGIVIGNSNIEVANNRCENIVAVGGNYGGDGGCIEIDDRYFGNHASDIFIHHNYSTGNMGFLEVERQVAGDNINVAYNFSDDYQEFIFFWGGENSKIENNTVIRTRPSLNNSVNTVFTMGLRGFEVKNNIFIVANDIQVWVTAPYNFNNGYEFAVKENNLYYCTDNCTDPSGLPAGKGEITGDPEFVNSGNGNYCLSDGSIARDAGQKLDYTFDIEGNDVPQGDAADIGAFECN